MALFVWSDKYSVNIKEIDSQHKKLVDLLNSLHDSMKVGRGSEVLGKTLTELKFNTWEYTLPQKKYS